MFNTTAMLGVDRLLLEPPKTRAKPPRPFPHRYASTTMVVLLAMPWSVDPAGGERKHDIALLTIHTIHTTIGLRSRV